jgi:hypothetical protein
MSTSYADAEKVNNDASPREWRDDRLLLVSKNWANIPAV